MNQSVRRLKTFPAAGGRGLRGGGYIPAFIIILSSFVLACGTQNQNAPDAGTDAGSDAGTEDAGFDGGSDYCENNQCFAVPPTGQIKCYNNGSIDGGADGGEIPCPPLEQRDALFWGQDAMFPKARTFKCYTGIAIEKPCSNYNLQEGDYVTDSLTGLMWQRALPAVYIGCTGGSPVGIKCKWREAIAYCSNLNYAGQTGWRLPNTFELAVIVDIQKFNPVTDTEVFPGTPGNYFWASSNVTVSGWGIEFEDGRLHSYYDYLYYFARCVKPGPVVALKDSARHAYAIPEDCSVQAQGRFVVTEPVPSQKVVTDSITGLMWQYNFVSNKNWETALNYCAPLNYGGYLDWRLPNRNELLSLADYSTYQPASAFPNLPQTSDNSFWSSSTVAADPANAWYVNFEYGDVFNKNKALPLYTRCVRLGP